VPWPARVGVVAAALAVSAGTATGEARAADPFALSASSGVGDLGAAIRQEVNARLNEAFSRGATGVDAPADVADSAADAAPVTAPATAAAVNGEGSASAPGASQPRPKARHAITLQRHHPAPRQGIRAVARAAVRSSGAYSESTATVEISLRTTRDYVPRQPRPRRPRTVAPSAPQHHFPTPASSDASAAVQGGHGSGLPLLMLLAALAGGLALYGMRHLLPPIPQAAFRKPRRSSLRPWRPG
jgi:hypothetical protein